MISRLIIVSLVSILALSGCKTAQNEKTASTTNNAEASNFVEPGKSYLILLTGVQAIVVVDVESITPDAIIGTLQRDTFNGMGGMVGLPSTKGRKIYVAKSQIASIIPIK